MAREDGRRWGTPCTVERPDPRAEYIMEFYGAAQAAADRAEAQRAKRWAGRETRNQRDWRERRERLGLDDEDLNEG
jgi:hypothetical protein